MKSGNKVKWSTILVFKSENRYGKIMYPGVLTIYTNHLDGNFRHKYEMS